MVSSRTSTVWHLAMNSRLVGAILALATALSVGAAYLLQAMTVVGPVWAGTAVILISYRYGPKGVVPAAALCGLLGGWLQAPSLSPHLMQVAGIMTSGYLAVGLVSAAAFYRLFRRLNTEHELRLQEVKAERNRAVDIAQERERLQQQLAFNATHDALTGLANRSLLITSIEDALAARRTDGKRCAVLFLDLDDFKAVNDTLGHAAGDRLLEVVGDRLANGIRANDLVARLGGDEFAVLFSEFDPAAADAVVNRVIGTLSSPVRLDTRTVQVRASAGLVVSDGSDTALGMLGKADLAMYSVKERGKASVAVFEQTMQSNRQERAELERDLRDALSNNQLSLAYQPLVDLTTGRLVGFEALSRWLHPVRGPVRPDEFIPLAEATGDIVPIGEWVLEQSCRRLSAWRQRLGGEAPFTMAVNLSARQLADEDVVARFADVLRRTAVDPRWVNLEITESMLLEDDDDSALDVLWQLRSLGVRLAVDDFGTGYSSLSRLNRLPINKLKIDKSFVLGIGPDSDGRANATLIASAVAMAHGLGLEVVAEGVEGQEHVALLRHVGCDIGQGYLFGRPAPPEEIDIIAPPYELSEPDGSLLQRGQSSDVPRRVGLMPSAYPADRRASSISSRIARSAPVPAPRSAEDEAAPVFGRRRTDVPLRRVSSV